MSRRGRGSLERSRRRWVSGLVGLVGLTLAPLARAQDEVAGDEVGGQAPSAAGAEEAPAQTPADAPSNAPPAPGNASKEGPPAPGAPGASSQSPPAPGSAPLGDERERIIAANEAFKQGTERYARGEYDRALEAFERAYRLAPSYALLYNVGGVCYQLGRRVRARTAFEQYLREARHDPRERQSVARVEQLLPGLEAATAVVVLSLNVAPDEVRLDGVALMPSDWSRLVVEPGEHRFVIEKQGFIPIERSLVVAGGERVQVVGELLPSPKPVARMPGPTRAFPVEPSRGNPPDAGDRVAPDEPSSPWVAWAVTGALTTGWGVAALLAVKARGDRDTIERPGQPASRLEDARDLHRALAVASDVLLASALASAGVSAYLTWWSGEPDASGVSLRGPSRPSRGMLVGLGATF